MKTFWIAVACLISAMTGMAQAQPVAEFYKDKTVKLMVGTEAGGGYDLLARLIARHLGKFIPGNPTVVVENMPGAASVKLANFIYNSAPPDGTHMALVQRGVLLSQLTGQSGVRFELSKFNWVYNVTSEKGVVVVWHTSPVKTFVDAQSRQVVIGGAGATSDTEASARLLNAIAGTKFKIVSGYPGTASILLAVQRGELEGITDLSLTELRSKNAALLDNNQLLIIAQHGVKRAPDLEDVPSVFEFVTNPDDQQVARLFYGLKSVARPILAGPEVPADRLAALRDAFAKMMADAEFRKDAASFKLDLNPTDHRAIEQFVALASGAPDVVRKRLTEILNPQSGKQ